MGSRGKARTRPRIVLKRGDIGAKNARHLGDKPRNSEVIRSAGRVVVTDKCGEARQEGAAKGACECNKRGGIWQSSWHEENGEYKSSRAGRRPKGGAGGKGGYELGSVGLGEGVVPCPRPVMAARGNGERDQFSSKLGSR